MTATALWLHPPSSVSTLCTKCFWVQPASWWVSLTVASLCTEPHLSCKIGQWLVDVSLVRTACYVTHCTGWIATLHICVATECLISISAYLVLVNKCKKGWLGMVTVWYPGQYSYPSHSLNIWPGYKAIHVLQADSRIVFRGFFWISRVCELAEVTLWTCDKLLPATVSSLVKQV